MRPVPLGTADPLAHCTRPIPLKLRWFGLNVEANVELDITALDAVEEVRAEVTGRGVVFAVAPLEQDVLALLEAYGIADRIGQELLFPTLPAAEDAYGLRYGTGPET